MKKEKTAKVKKEKLPKKKFSLRVKDNINSSVNSFKEFFGITRRSLVVYGSLGLFVAALSMILTAFWQSDIGGALYVMNIFPRLATLFIFVLPSFIFSYRRTLFTIGSSIWMTWVLYAYNCRVSWVLLAFTIGILISGFCFKIDTNKPWYSKGRGYMVKVAEWYYAGVIIVLALEVISRMNLINSLHMFFMNPDTFGNNLLIFMCIGAFILLLPKRKLVFFIYSTFWVILAYASYLKCLNISEPAYLLDIFQLSEAISAMFTYLNFFDVFIVIVMLALLVLGIRLLAKKEKSRPFRIANIALMLAVYLLCWGVFACITQLPYFVTSRSGENKKDAFYRNGFVYSFVNSVAKSGVSMPTDYSANAVKALREKIENEYVSRETDGTKKDVNVIAIQLESYVDSYFFEDMEYEYDPLPFLHSLKENYSSGIVDVPVFGGQTVKSEFEFMTGLSMDNLPSGYNPYVQYVLRHPMDNISKYFKDRDYTITCIHDYQGEFFNRDQVYNKLGFDRFIPRECMPDVEWRGQKIIFGNDSTFTPQIKQVMDASEGPDFIFGITCQLHGSYEPIPKEDYPMQMALKPDEDGVVNEEFEGQIAYYTKEMIKFDEAIKSIIEYLEERGEPTYVIMYSDHLPTLCNDVVSNEDRYRTQYFTWNNLGIEKDDDHEMELYMLSTYMCQQLGIDGTEINKFHSLYEDTPENAKDFSYLQYYKMYEEEYDLYPAHKQEASGSSNATFYVFEGIVLVLLVIFTIIMIGKKRFVMVICVTLLVVLICGAITILVPSSPAKPVTLADSDKSFHNDNYIISQIKQIKVEKIALSDEILICYGSGFTQDTHISINGKNYMLTYVDDNTAIIMGFDAPIQDGDRITLRIVGARNGGTFTETEPYPYDQIDFAVEILPQRIQDKIAEIIAASITPSPTPEITPTPEGYIEAEADETAVTTPSPVPAN